ncbi:hypothetical protein BN7_1998 [Wickerhamomyces ciferrii]|uniref:Uncharacterized protein n=1 Tax=Wickerhamomyces ciferrii (strain ATCC 14091 / BCRC 22168 / CBS 111 / JCM 3599 / NBRC 0793 / NRRL Y-1031 F-60-10) TaxID=1206466 RepID=K0KMU8_WICCF|nr:uncharacterized protein BN7_1998 [Wickerhamomyces ciferrii]CCH42453.1 hypothetical protein BN7_1998 [Wickerhamomyces ciferrii]
MSSVSPTRSPTKSPLRDSQVPNQVLQQLPKLEFEAPSPLVKTSPTRTASGLGSPMRVRENIGLGSPRRLSPNKNGLNPDPPSFTTTPRRILPIKRSTQSVDRNGFEPQEESKPEITFNSLKGLAPSNLRTVARTPSRRGVRTRTLPNSDRVFRFNAQPLNVGAKDINTNLLDKFKAQGKVKSCLKSTNDNIANVGVNIKASSESSSDEDNDMRTTLNTLKNAANAKDVKAFLSSGNENAELVQPRKRKRAVSFNPELNQIAETIHHDDINNDNSTQRLLNLVLQNQEIIMSKLDALEKRLK